MTLEIAKSKIRTKFELELTLFHAHLIQDEADKSLVENCKSDSELLDLFYEMTGCKI